MAMRLKNFARQTAALTEKNLVIAVYRHPVSTLLRALLLPVAFLVLILEVKVFLADPNTYGVGSPVPVQALNGGLLGGRDLVFVTPPTAGPDIDLVVQKINGTLQDVSSQLVYYTNETNLLTHCLVNIHGVSNCYAALVFNDSPLTTGGSSTWSYTIRADPKANGYPIDVFSQNNDQNTLWLPLQLAIENAITNSTVVPDAFMFTSATQAQEDLFADQHFLDLVIRIYTIALFIVNLSVVYHVVGMITAERESGMSQLMDVMGTNASARVLSYLLAFALIYLPCWIVSGFLYWHLLIPASNAAVPVFWYILTGWSITSASVFAAAFFSKYQLSGVYAVVGFLIVAFGGMIMDSNPLAPRTGPVTALSFIFPSMNFDFALAIYCRFQALGLPVDMLRAPPPAATNQPVPSSVSTVELWAFLIMQIVVYAALAIALEKFRHGVDYSHREFTNGTDADDNGVALRTTGLGKVYPTPWYRGVFSSRSPPDVVALAGLDLVGQKRQILCLLGANGSGKTTTLDLICGIRRPTAGAVKINASATQLGLCPQRNVLFNELTVHEHARLWSRIKGGREDAAALAHLIEACDLSAKKTARADRLSGGQKRKLQLACAFVGDSSLCLMDEVTTGLDPISRRHIWNIILAERSKRSMILTTHYLDECEVLADHIAILSRGSLRCQGSTPSLLLEYGGGYRVHATRWDGDTGKTTGILSTIHHQDRVVYTVPDSASAASLISKLSERGQTDVSLTGPTVEDAFLAVSDEHLAAEDAEENQGSSTEAARRDLASEELKQVIAADGGEQLSSAKPASFATQILVLFRKRLHILRRNWWPYFFAVAVPVAVTPALNKFLYLYVSPNCADVLADVYKAIPFALQSTYTSRNGPIENPLQLAVGPPSANASIYHTLSAFPIGKEFNLSGYGSELAFRDTLGDLESFVSASFANITVGALWMGGNGTNPTFAYEAEAGMLPGLVMQNLWSQARSNISIAGAYEFLASRISPQAGNSLGYAAYFCLIQLVYPALFCIYPAYERLHRVRALQYSNGVRPLPLWLAYTLFDMCFVLVISAALTITTWQQFPYWYNVGYIFPVLVLHGLAATLMGYVISTVAGSQLAAFGFSVGTSALMFALSMVTFSLEEAFTNPATLESTMNATNFSLDLIFPIGNVFRAIVIGLNIFVVTCQGTELILYPGSIYAYGGPILYLCLQICFFWLLLQWLDRGSFPTLAGNYKYPAQDDETAATTRSPEVEQEVARAEASEADLLRLLHTSKAYGANLAVDDVTLGLGEGEILALLGANGAGKTTIVDMIRGELKPDRGSIFVRGVDAVGQARQAQAYLGVCPQFDALDFLTAREHLEFYARAKGIEDVRQSVDTALVRAGLTHLASLMPAQLSGGNKRKLSLAIALIGNPPILLLDEPSSSLDPSAKRRLWRTLARAIAPGRAVLLTTHSMEEADALATRAAVLARRVLAVGSTQALRARHGGAYHVRVALRGATGPGDRVEKEGDEEARVRTMEAWVASTFPGAVVDGPSLGGQVRFTLPAEGLGGRGSESSDRGGVGDLVIRHAGAREGPNVAAELIEQLERQKEELGIDHYSVGATTLERVFMSVVRDNDVGEEEPRKGGWRHWW